MFKPKPLVFAAVLAVVTLIGAAGCTQADLLALQGTLKEVDSASGTVTVTLKDGTTRTFNFTNVKVDTIRQTLGGATLEIGDNVTVTVRRNGDVEEVDADNAEVSGIIKNLGADNVTIATNKQGEITLNVTSQTKICIGDNRTAAFSGLKSGQQVEAKYDVTTKDALRINVNTGEDKHQGEISGVVKAVDLTNKTVTIGRQHGDNVTLNVTANTTIRIEDHRTAALTDMKPGQKIQASYDKATMNAFRLAIEINDEGEQSGNRQNSQGRNSQRQSGDHPGR